MLARQDFGAVRLKTAPKNLWLCVQHGIAGVLSQLTFMFLYLFKTYVITSPAKLSFPWSRSNFVVHLFISGIMINSSLSNLVRLRTMRNFLFVTLIQFSQSFHKFKHFKWHSTFKWCLCFIKPSNHAETLTGSTFQQRTRWCALPPKKALATRSLYSLTDSSVLYSLTDSSVLSTALQTHTAEQHGSPQRGSRVAVAATTRARL